MGQADPRERPPSAEPPLSRARWLLASVLAVASMGGIAVSLMGSGPVRSAPAPSRPIPERSSSAAEPGSIVRLIDINSAPPESLQMLPGIGAVLAQRIAEDRLANGAFAELDDLDRVKGIGPRTIEKLRPLARAGDP